MARFTCRCGNTIVVIPPSHHSGYVVWDCDVDLSIETRRKEIHGFLQALAGGHRDAFLRYFYGSAEAEEKSSLITDADVIEDILSKHDRYTRICYRCPKCDRVFIEAESGSAQFKAYTVDED